MLRIYEKSCVGSLWPTVVYIRINDVYVVFAMLRLVSRMSNYSPVTSLYVWGLITEGNWKITARCCAWTKYLWKRTEHTVGSLYMPPVDHNIIMNLSFSSSSNSMCKIQVLQSQSIKYISQVQQIVHQYNSVNMDWFCWKNESPRPKMLNSPADGSHGGGLESLPYPLSWLMNKSSTRGRTELL